MNSPNILSGDFEKAREQIHRQMLSAVSHDLKTPLATIIGSLEIYTRMNDKLTAEKKIMLINSALGEAYRLDSFVTNILDMAKLESDMVKIKCERYDLASILQDCITRLGPKAKKADVKIQPAGSSGIMVNTDPMLLGRAIGLVLDNAIRHSGKQQQPVITAEYGCKGNDAFVSIHDNGQGIPTGREEEIFSKYTRFAKNDTQNAGTGLGLAICRQIMSLLEGSVTVQNHADGGAVFTLRFVSF